MELLQLLQLTWASVLQGELPHTDIIKALITKFLGYGILAGSCITKLPQILNVVKSGSADGLSPISFELETYTYLVHAGYGYLKNMPFSGYGETVILAVQNLALLGLIYQFSGSRLQRPLTVYTIYCAMCAAVLSGSASVEVWRSVYELNNFVVMAARIPQILKNYREKNTGQLSLITNAINVAGCAVRIFTSLQEGGGTAMVRSYVIGLVLNLTLVIQILLYSRNKVAKLKAETKKMK